MGTGLDWAIYKIKGKKPPGADNIRTKIFHIEPILFAHIILALARAIGRTAHK